MFHGSAHGAVRHSDAPSLLLEPQSSIPSLCSPLLPPEMSEIAASAVKPLSRKKLKQISRQTGENQQPLLAAMEADLAKDRLPTAPVIHTDASRQSQHRERQAPTGDQMNPLIAWYSLVAKPIPRKLWATMPKAQAAVDAEWDKLRAADGGRGTWDESTVTNYWDAQRQAKEKLERTGVHTHTLVRSLTCA